jgi:hypothetical protein
MAKGNWQRLALSTEKARTRSELAQIERQIQRLVYAILAGADANAINTRLKDGRADAEGVGMSGGRFPTLAAGSALHSSGLSSTRS